MLLKLFPHIHFRYHINIAIAPKVSLLQKIGMTYSKTFNAVAMSLPGTLFEINFVYEIKFQLYRKVDYG